MLPLLAVYAIIVPMAGAHFDSIHEAHTEPLYASTQFGNGVMLSVISLVALLLPLLFLVSGLMVRPLKNLVATVEKSAEGRLSRARVRGNDEFARLGKGFNTIGKKLAESERSREEFVANVSHDLKTPLSSIKVLTETTLIMENATRQMYDDILQYINSEIDRMTNIVNDLLELVKLDNEEGTLNLEYISVNKVVEDVLRRLYPLAQKKSLEFVYKSVREVRTVADTLKISLAISNVVENAIKYTNPFGRITIEVDADQSYAFINVVDTGIGISLEDQPKVFLRFYRADKARHRDTGGTGLGLAITETTFLVHGGDIRLTSTEGEGSTFLMRLPMIRP